MPIADEQFGSIPGRGTTGAILTGGGNLWRNIGGNRKELLDLEKAHDRVPRQEVWRCMMETGVPEEYVQILGPTGCV